LRGSKQQQQDGFVLVLTLTLKTENWDWKCFDFGNSRCKFGRVGNFDFLFEDHCRGNQNNNKVCFGLDVTKFGSRRLFGFGFTLKNED
jgi:hypothetical protein